MQYFLQRSDEEKVRPVEEHNQFDVYWVEVPRMKHQLVVNQNELFLRVVAKAQRSHEGE